MPARRRAAPLALAVLPAFVALVAGFLTTGCARPVLRTREGAREAVRVHAPKAYLALSRLAAPGADGATHETRLLLLPDLDDPRWISLRAGWGSIAFEADLEHGMLAGLEVGTEARAGEVGRALADASDRVVGRLTAHGTSGARAAPWAGEAPIEALYEVATRPSGEVDLVEVPPAAARRLLARVADLPPRALERRPP